jgi:Ca2+-binding EF-hand superfamily protein/2-polyprenyl-3-methyl-5-hydroxy-6-metoxy-1,4-benzoquinol methylase
MICPPPIEKVIVMDNYTASLKKTFDLFDKDGNGTIDKKEIQQVLQSLGQNITEKDIEAFLFATDKKDGNSKIDFKNFCLLSNQNSNSNQQDQELRGLFERFDKNNDGRINLEEMTSEAISILDQHISEKDIIEIFCIADTDGSGELDYHEFANAIMSKSVDMQTQEDDTHNAYNKIIPPSISEDDWRFIETLELEIQNHKAFNHSYLKRLAAGDLPDTFGALQDYAIQYGQYSKNFKHYINLIRTQLDNPEHKSLISHNYKEESGHLENTHLKQLADIGIEAEWVENIPHTALFNRFQTALGITEEALKQSALEAQQFAESAQSLCHQDAMTAIGAIGFAGELGVKKTYNYILQAITAYTSLAPREYVFFSLHAEIDDAHAHDLKRIAADLLSQAGNREKLTKGMKAMLAARCAFWDAMLERALQMPEKAQKFSSPAQLYAKNSQQWVRQKPSCLSDFTGRPAIFNLCEPVKDAVILDLGCGEGYCSRELMRRGARQVIGVDLSANLIHAAQMEEQRESLGITYLNGKANQIKNILQQHQLLNKQEGGFDLIIAVFLFNYLTIYEMHQCMTQVRSLLKPDGRFIFSVPHPSFAFWGDTDSRFHFDRESLAVNQQQCLGYFSARDRLLPGTIARRDGEMLKVQLRHKTLQDYFESLHKSGFNTLPTVQELKVTDEHMQLDRAFFATLYDIPLHMAFSIRKQAEMVDKSHKKLKTAPIKDIIWSRLFTSDDYCFQLPIEVLEEFQQALGDFQRQGITWENYISDGQRFQNLRDFSHKMRNCCYDRTGFVLIQGLPLERFGNTYEEREATAKLFYYMMSCEIGLISERRGRLYDVRDRGLDVGGDNVLFSASREASGWHTDSSDKDFQPDIVGLLCLQNTSKGGTLKNINVLNVYYRLKQILPMSIFDELERPIVRDLIEKGMGQESGDIWEQLRRNPNLNMQKYRLRNNQFPVFSRDPYTNEFSCRYMRYWIESGHEKAGIPLSPLLRIALNALDDVIENDPSIYRIERKLKLGEIIYTNNHICLHNRTAYEDEEGQPKRHMVRAWIDFTPNV